MSISLVALLTTSCLAERLPVPSVEVPAVLAAMTVPPAQLQVSLQLLQYRFSIGTIAAVRPTCPSVPARSPTPSATAYGLRPAVPRIRYRHQLKCGGGFARSHVRRGGRFPSAPSGTAPPPHAGFPAAAPRRCDGTGRALVSRELKSDHPSPPVPLVGCCVGLRCAVAAGRRAAGGG